uniref:Secreted protein n=1 Tax=Achlya hypogyna TaxID=1202772 RepID=A0A0A7CPU1_ACHHY|nr:secreted protein [Achlya hypogyna]
MKTTLARFVLALVTMLATEDASILGWEDDGKCIEIRDRVRFVQHVLPKYFRHAQYNSFQRQLSYYGFRRVKGRLDLLPLIVRAPYSSSKKVLVPETCDVKSMGMGPSAALNPVVDDFLHDLLLACPEPAGGGLPSVTPSSSPRNDPFGDSAWVDQLLASPTSTKPWTIDSVLV